MAVSSVAPVQGVDDLVTALDEHRARVDLGARRVRARRSGALADFLGKEDCLVFSTGYAANLGLISGLIGRGELVYLDKLDHASIVDGAKGGMFRLQFGNKAMSKDDAAGLIGRLQREKIVSLAVATP